MTRRQRRQQEAIPAVIRSYLGEGRALVTLPGREEQFEVGTDRTYAPGSEVLIARPLGMMGQAVIIAGPPPAAAGASRVQPSVARVAPEPDPEPPAPAYAWLAYVESAGTVYGWTYDDAGAVVSTLSSYTPPSDSLLGLITPASRSAPIVCDALVDGGGVTVGIVVVNVETGEAYTRSTPAGWLSSAPVSRSGSVYWCEAEVSPGAGVAPEVVVYSVPASAGSHTPTEVVRQDLATPWGGGSLDEVETEGIIGASLAVGFRSPVANRRGIVVDVTTGGLVETGQPGQDRAEHSYDGGAYQYDLAPFGDVERVSAADRDSGSFGGPATPTASEWGSGNQAHYDVVGSDLWILDHAGGLHRGTEAAPEAVPVETILLTAHPVRGLPTRVHRAG